MSEHVQGSEVRRVRERLGEHQAQFGQRFGVTRRTIIRWEKGGTVFTSWGGWDREDRKTPADLWLATVKAADARKNSPRGKSPTALATRKSRGARRRPKGSQAASRRKGRKSPASNRARRRKPVTRRARAARRRRVTRRKGRR